MIMNAGTNRILVYESGEYLIEPVTYFLELQGYRPIQYMHAQEIKGDIIDKCRSDDFVYFFLNNHGLKGLDDRESSAGMGLWLAGQIPLERQCDVFLYDTYGFLPFLRKQASSLDIKVIDGMNLHECISSLPQYGVHHAKQE